MHTKRALVLFLLAYLTITVLAFWLYLAILAIKGQSINAAANIREDPSYLLAEKLYPLLNLLVWGAYGWLYFRKRAEVANVPREAFRLGMMWLAVALPVDLVGFVLIKNPLSLSAHDFYVGQFPWIYLTYVAVSFGPLCWVGLRTLRVRARQ